MSNSFEEIVAEKLRKKAEGNDYCVVCGDFVYHETLYYHGTKLIACPSMPPPSGGVYTVLSITPELTELLSKMKQR